MAAALVLNQTEITNFIDSVKGFLKDRGIICENSDV